MCQNLKLGTLDFTIRDKILTPGGVAIESSLFNTFEYKYLHTKETQVKAS